MRKSRSLFTDAKPRRTGALVYPMLLILLLAVIVALNFVNNGRVKLLNEDVTITSIHHLPQAENRALQRRMHHGRRMRAR